MKFSWKICVSVLAFSLLIVGIGGYALLSALFQSSFQREVKSAADENRMLQYSFAAYWTTTVQDRSSGFPETDVRRAAQAMQEGMSGTELRFQLYNQEGRELYDSGAEEILRDSQREALFSAASGETGARMMVRTGEGFGLATVSTVLMEDGTLLYLETDRDVTALFADRESQYGIYRRWMAGLLLLGNSYFLLLGPVIGLVDALPVFGAGTVLIPWFLISFLQGRWGQGLALLFLYLVCYLLRQVAEARLMGGQVGLTALETLFSMYVGLRLFGIAGFLLGPIGFLMIEDLLRIYGGNSR